MQDYLKAIYQLEERGEDATPKALAEALDVTPASASNMAKRLAEIDLVEHERYKGVELTAAGELAALEVIRHHRLLELFLVETLGVPWDEVHEEAEVLEHHISEKLEARIAERLGHPERDPHGDPIPSLNGEIDAQDGVALTDASPSATVRLLRVGDQDPDVLQFLGDQGLFPGAEVEVTRVDPNAGVVAVEVDGEDVHIGMHVARAVRVDVVEAPDEEVAAS